MFTERVSKINAILPTKKFMTKNKFFKEFETQGNKQPTSPFSIFEEEQSIQDDKKSFELNRIANKLNAGKKLSGKELVYLRDNAPGLYAKAVKMKRMREDFEQKLKSAKSKEDARDIYDKEVQLGCKGSDSTMKINTITEAYKDFKYSDSYKKLSDKKKNKLEFLTGKEEKYSTEKKQNSYEEVLESIDGRYVVSRYEREQKFDRKA